MGRETCRRSAAPTFPTSKENRTLAAHTAAATGASPGLCGAEATAPNAKTRNSGPGGCQSWTEETTVPSPATRQQPATTSQSCESAAAASTPRTTEPVRAAPALACMAARDRWTWLRPYNDVNAPKTAYGVHAGLPRSRRTSRGTPTLVPARSATRCAPGVGCTRSSSSVSTDRQPLT